MGCSVIWSYIDQYGDSEFKKMVLVDQQPLMLANSDWSETKKIEIGSTMEFGYLYTFINKIAGKNGSAVREQFINSRFTDQFDKKQLEWIIFENLKLQGKYAAALLLNHLQQD